jgi:hypothetical protein
MADILLTQLSSLITSDQIPDTFQFLTDDFDALIGNIFSKSLQLVAGVFTAPIYFIVIR